MSYSGTAHYFWFIGICALSLEHEPELRDSKADIWQLGPYARRANLKLQAPNPDLLKSRKSGSPSTCTSRQKAQK